MNSTYHPANSMVGHMYVHIHTWTWSLWGYPLFPQKKLQHALPKRIEGLEMGVEGFRVGV